MAVLYIGGWLDKYLLRKCFKLLLETKPSFVHTMHCELLQGRHVLRESKRTGRGLRKKKKLKIDTGHYSATPTTLHTSGHYF